MNAFRDLACRACAAFLILVGLPGAAGAAQAQQTGERPPNVVIVFTDDLGYGDLPAFGHPTIRTPHLDRMAEEGTKLTQFYVAASVCTPSRAALLTGRLPVRSGTASDEARVFFPDSENGLPLEEVTIAEMLKAQGYATAAIGKWHLGHRERYLPTNQGFDSYFGVPYSNDMDRTAEAFSHRRYPEGSPTPEVDWFHIPLMRDTEIIERPADQRTLTRRYGEEAVRFIENHQDEPFFLYLAHSLPHVPLFRSEAFEGVSRRGLYGDVVEEIDGTVGQVIEALEQAGQAENTLLVFTSDNGPWLPYNQLGGSAGLLRGGKGSTWDGGVRVPALAWWPGQVEAGAVTPALTSSMDLLPTAAALSGASMPSGRIIDGESLMPVLRGATDEGRETLFFYRGERLYAVRMGPWKAHLITQSGYGDDEPERHTPPLLFHMEHDPSEKHDVAEENPDVIEEIRRVISEHRARLTRGEDQLEARSQEYRTFVEE